MAPDTRRLLPAPPPPSLPCRLMHFGDSQTDEVERSVCVCDIFGLNHLRVNCIYQSQFSTFTFFVCNFEDREWECEKRTETENDDWVEWRLRWVVLVVLGISLHSFFIYLLFITNIFPVAKRDRGILEQTHFLPIIGTSRRCCWRGWTCALSLSAQRESGTERALEWQRERER